MVWSQEADVWRWRLEDSGVFTVKSAYISLEEVVLSEDRWREDEKGVFKCLWKIPAPSKVVAFGWKVFLNRIPSKVNLVLRHVLPHEESSLCAVCARMEKTSLHIFLHCDLAISVWLRIMLSLDCLFLTPSKSLCTLGMLGRVGKKQEGQKGH